MKIYTKTGDAGQTGLFGGGRVSKDDERVDAYGEVDELNAAVGLAGSLLSDEKLKGLCLTIQEQLFTLGAVLATPAGSKASTVIPHIQPEWALAMEHTIDELDTEIGPLNSFILPGGDRGASALHFARTVCRRAERKVVGLARSGVAGPDELVYLNRLSDYLFTLARAANHRARVADVPWVPPKSV